MLKSFSRLWRRTIKRLNRAQQTRNVKLVKSLLSVASPKTRPARASAVKKKSVVNKSRSAIRAAGPPAAAPGKWLASYYSSVSVPHLQANRTSYWLYLPDSAKKTPLPLVVMLHGCQQSATQFSQGTRMNQLAEQKGFAVLYPQQSLKAHRHRCWHWYSKENQGGGGEAKLIAELVDDVMRRHGLDRRRAYICGLSAGAAMANIVAFNYPGLIAAVGLHSAPVFGVGHTHMEAFAVMQHGAAYDIQRAIGQVEPKFDHHSKMPAILIHGKEDKVVRAVNQAQLALQFRVLNRLSGKDEVSTAFDARGDGSKAYRTFDYFDGEKLLLRVCDIADLDHAWSGGDCTLPHNSCAGPDASRMMWDFFSKHQRPIAQPSAQPSYKDKP